MKCKCGAIVNPSWPACLACKSKIEKPKLAPAMVSDVARTMAADSERMFLRQWRRTANRLGRVYTPGCLAWVQVHQPELWAWREAARTAWDDPVVYADFKSCRIPWTAYRRWIYAWARVEMECVRAHRDHLTRVGCHAA